MHWIVLGVINSFLKTTQEDIPKGLQGDLALCSNAILEALDLAVDHEKTEPQSYIVGNDIADVAFGTKYTPYSGEEAFLDHLQAQKASLRQRSKHVSSFFLCYSELWLWQVLADEASTGTVIT